MKRADIQKINAFQDSAQHFRSILDTIRMNINRYRLLDSKGERVQGTSSVVVTRLEIAQAIRKGGSDFRYGIALACSDLLLRLTLSSFYNTSSNIGESIDITGPNPMVSNEILDVILTISRDSLENYKLPKY